MVHSPTRSMLRATLRSMQALPRCTLRQPLSQWIHPRQLRAAVVAPRSAATSTGQNRLSQTRGWRAIHTTRQRLAAEKTPEPEKGRGWDGLRDWGILSYEPVDREGVDNIFFAIAVALGAYIAYLEIPKHLPVRTNPNFLLKESLEIIKKREQVTSRLGTPLVGRGERVLRSHQVESVKIKGEDGKPSRLRIKYNVTGPNGKAIVFAEVTEGSAKDEYNYLVVQFDDTKEIVTVIDHRDTTHGNGTSAAHGQTSPVSVVDAGA